MHQKSIVNINPKSQLLLMRHLRWIHILQSLHQQSATPKHRRKKFKFTKEMETSELWNSEELSGEIKAAGGKKNLTYIWQDPEQHT
jgi:hypothetical protein